MQTTLDYRTNRDLFSNRYLDERLPETEEWNAADEAEVREAYEERGWTWSEGTFVATDSGVVGFDHELTFFHEGERIDRWLSNFEPGEYSSLFVMEPGEGTTYEYPVRDAPVPTSFEVLVTQIREESS